MTMTIGDELGFQLKDFYVSFERTVGKIYIFYIYMLIYLFIFTF